MNSDRLPELLRGLGVEPFLDDEVALDLASRARGS
jgi:hypothetical protein